MAMLEVKNLEVYYGVIQAIKGISFEVNEIEEAALIPEEEEELEKIRQSQKKAADKHTGANHSANVRFTDS